MTDTLPRLIIGGDSAIGAALAQSLARSGAPVLATTRRRERAGDGAPYLDLMRPGPWRLPAASVAYVAAAVARLRAVRENWDAAWQINVVAPERLARVLVEGGSFVVFLSSDKVFDGRRPDYPADAAPNGTCAYGRQKAEAERRLLALGPGVAILRLSKVVGASDALFTSWIAALRQGRPVTAFADYTFAPLAMATVVRALAAIGERRAGGIWQLSGRRDVSYAEAARHLAARLGADPALVREAAAADAGLPPDERPPHTTLDSRRLADELGIVAAEGWGELDRGLEIGAAAP